MTQMIITKYNHPFVLINDHPFFFLLKSIHATALATFAETVGGLALTSNLKPKDRTILVSLNMQVRNNNNNKIIMQRNDHTLILNYYFYFIFTISTKKRLVVC